MPIIESQEGCLSLLKKKLRPRDDTECVMYLGIGLAIAMLAFLMFSSFYQIYDVRTGSAHIIASLPSATVVTEGSRQALITCVSHSSIRVDDTSSSLVQRCVKSTQPSTK